MSNNQSWLQRLNEATDYRQLQEVFAHLSEAAEHTENGQQVAESIDEAVRRIEQERSRDDEELKEFESRYAEFKEQQRGVLGWFRRHMPFTKTRKQEVQHKDTIADQQAEILADNFIIARAQMLKQRLLPAEQRQLGESSARWKSRLSQCESIQQVGDYASTIRSLSAELAVSEAFVGEITAEIDAFAKADFAAKEDRAQKKADLDSARRELSEFENELQEEQSIRSAAMKRAGELVTEEMLLGDHDFYQLTNQLENLEQGKKFAKRASKSASEFAKLLGEVEEHTQASESCRQENEHLATERQRLQSELEPHQDRLKRLTRKLAKASEPFEVAQQAADQAEAAFAAAKRIHDQQADAVDDVVKSEYERLSRQRDAALNQLASDKSSYDSVKSKHDKVQTEVNKTQQELKDLEQRVDRNKSELNRLSNQLQQAADKIPPALAEFEPVLNEFLRGIESLPVKSHVESLNRTVQGRDALSQLTVEITGKNSPDDSLKQRIDRLVDAIDRDKRELKKLASSAHEERQQRWLRRCQELLGDEITQSLT